MTLTSKLESQDISKEAISNSIALMLTQPISHQDTEVSKIVSVHWEGGKWLF